jgi:hypothetical protein
MSSSSSDGKVKSSGSSGVDEACQSLIESVIKSQSFNTIIESKANNDPFLHVNLN